MTFLIFLPLVSYSDYMFSDIYSTVTEPSFSRRTLRPFKIAKIATPPPTRIANSAAEIPTVAAAVAVSPMAAAPAEAPPVKGSAAKPAITTAAPPNFAALERFFLFLSYSAISPLHDIGNSLRLMAFCNSSLV